MADARQDAPVDGRGRTGMTVPGWDEEALIARLRAGDEDAFRILVTRHFSAMVRVASTYVPSRAVAEEVVQETWLAILQGLDRFEGRSSLKTWMFRILTNRARTRGVREHRTTPLSALDADDGPVVDGDRFLDRSHRWAGHWAQPPEPWSDVPGEAVASGETRRVVHETIQTMGAAQRQVITLRDIEGWSPGEVCDALGLSDVNQRVLLHRARAKVRTALERHFSDVVAS